VVLLLFGWVGVLSGKSGIGVGIMCPVVLGVLVKLGAVPWGSWPIAVGAHPGSQRLVAAGATARAAAEAGAGVLDGFAPLGRGACC
jgi:hypothetical protein